MIDPVRSPLGGYPPGKDQVEIATVKNAALHGVQLAYNTCGRGAPVLLIMGYGVPGRAWVHQVAPLSRRHQVAWYDHRGIGNTRAAPGAYSMRLLASDALGLIDELGWEAVHVVGVSMGGMVAQEVALAARGRVRSLTLIVSHAGGMAARLPAPAGLSRFVRASVGVGSPRRRLRSLQRLLFPDDFLARCDRRWLQDVLRSDFGEPVPALSRWSQLAAVMRHDTRRRLHRLAGLPTLVVKAGQDVLVRSAESDRLARLIPGARLRTFHEAGHGIIRQCHEALNQELLAHFEAAAGAGGQA